MKFQASILILILFLISITLSVEAGRKRYSDRHDVRRFVRTITAKHHFNRAELLGLFRKARRQQSALDAISKPAERKLLWSEYRSIFVTDQRIKGGVEFWSRHADVLRRAKQQFGVPEEIIVAIIGVETRYGEITGRYPVFDALVTLAFDGKKRKSFFRSELESFLLLARDEKLNPREVMGSYAGAMGIPQFISSSYRAYAVDFNEDGIRNLLTDPVDAIGSVANYFARHGWKAGEMIITPAEIENDEARKMAVGRGRKGLKPEFDIKHWRSVGIKLNEHVGDNKLAVLIELEKPDQPEYWMGMKNFYVISRYNNSSMYAMAVFQLGNEIKRFYKNSESNVENVGHK
jgi:membrane-bound lytic murein transglycosylase B